VPLAGRIGALAALLVVGLACAGSVDRSCHHAGPPVSVPDPGTARAGFCSAVQGHVAWPLLALVPVVLGALALVLLRRSPRGSLAATLVLVAAAVAVAVVAAALPHALTI
jgi:hypothetical protein